MERQHRVGMASGGSVLSHPQTDASRWPAGRVRAATRSGFTRSVPGA